MNENCELYDFLQQFESYEERERVIEAIRMYHIHQESWENEDEEEWSD